MSAREAVREIDTGIADAARLLYPAWLPDAAAIESPAGSGSGAAAVRAIARREAQRGLALGAVVEPLALAALARRTASLAPLADETVVRECMRLVAASYGGRPTAVVFGLPAPDGHEVALSHAVTWFGSLDVATVRLAGPGAACIKGVWVEAPDVPARDAPVPAAATLYLTPLTGRPSPTSQTENDVERFLRKQLWAAGRRWQIAWQADRVSPPVRVDLMFPDAGLVVEFDGHEHGSPRIYAADRRRDRALLASGLRVVRFTNAEVAADLGRVADEIRCFVTAPRSYP